MEGARRRWEGGKSKEGEGMGGARWRRDGGKGKEKVGRGKRQTITVTVGFVMVEMGRATGEEETGDCIQREHEREEKKKKGREEGGKERNGVGGWG